jgi:hypothetical protein
MADPTDAVAVAEVEHVTGCRVDPVLMTVSAVEELVEKTYRALVTEVMKRVDDRGDEPASRPRGKDGRDAAWRSLARDAAARDQAEPAPGARAAAGGDGASTDGPTTVPFHRLSEEADVDTRLHALVRVLLAKGLVSEEELEEEVGRLLRTSDDTAD